MYKNSQCSTYSPLVRYVRLLDCNRLGEGVVSVVNAGLICFSLIIREIKDLFIFIAYLDILFVTPIQNSCLVF